MKKIHRFLLPPDLAHQLRDVLKLKEGEEIDLMDGTGVEARAKIVATKPSVEVEIESVRRATTEPTTKVILYCAILKRENFELVVQKATEVGATEIVPIISARTIKTGLKHDRLAKIAAEAAEQSGRGVVPSIHEAMSLKEALIHAARNDQNYFLDPTGEVNVVNHVNVVNSVGLFIGPEGGWTDEEIALAKSSGITPISLGDLILRGETAAIVATYLAACGKL